LYRRSPSLRGDDVAELQQRLCALGFDTGRVDGIYGDATAQAVREFQQDSALAVDGILGADTISALRRVEGRDQHRPLVSTVRAREMLRQAPPTLTGRHVAIGEPGGLGVGAGALRRRLSGTGARVTTVQHPDDSVQARQANLAGADVYLGLRLDPRRTGCLSAFYSGYRDESVGGRLLAEAVQAVVPGALAIADLGAHGMSLRVLRETRMTAVVVEVGPAAVLVERALTLADALAGALTSWVSGPWE
jgi:N-acetylmuramoyl-L-alanine amidase